MKQRELEQIINDLLGKVQRHEERLNTLERGVFIKLPNPFNKQEITKMGNEIIDKEEK